MSVCFCFDLRCSVFPRLLSLTPNVPWHAVWLPFDFDLSVCVCVWVTQATVTQCVFDKCLTHAVGWDFMRLLIKLLPFSLPAPHVSHFLLPLLHVSFPKTHTPIITASDGAQGSLSHCLHAPTCKCVGDISPLHASLIAAAVWLHNVNVLLVTRM